MLASMEDMADMAREQVFTGGRTNLEVILSSVF